MDDHEIFRRGLVSAIADDQELEVVLDASEGPIERSDLDVVVIDSTALDGLVLDCPVVVLAQGSGRWDMPYGTKTGVSAILPRENLTVEKVVAAVRAAAAGLRVDVVVEEDRRDAPLDDRRLGVLRLLAEGADTRTIARNLQYSERTVKTLIHDIELTLGAQTRAQAVAEAFRLGLI